MNLWVFDSDGVLYDHADAERAWDSLFFDYISLRTGLLSEEYERLKPTLIAKHQARGLIVAFIREFGLDFDDCVAATYLKLDLERYGITKNQIELQKTISRFPDPKVVFSSSPQRYVEYVLEHLGIQDLFCQVIGLERAEFQYKPSPLAFAAVEKLFPKAQSIFFCDDTNTNLDIASMRGWRTFWLNRKDIATPAKALGQHVIVSSLSEILDHLPC